MMRPTLLSIGTTSNPRLRTQWMQARIRAEINRRQAMETREANDLVEDLAAQSPKRDVSDTNCTRASVCTKHTSHGHNPPRNAGSSKGRLVSWRARIARWLGMLGCLLVVATSRSQTTVTTAAGAPFPWERSGFALRSYPGDVDLLGGNLLTRILVTPWPMAGGASTPVFLFHNTFGGTASSTGTKWSHSLELVAIPGLDFGDVAVRLGDGATVRFLRNLDGSFTAPPGIDATLTPDASGWVMRTSDSTTFVFSPHASGKVPCREISDSAGNRLAIAVDFNGQPTQATDNTGRWVRFHIANQRLRRIERSTGEVWDLAHDAQGNVQRIVFPAAPGETTLTHRQFSYDKSSRILSSTDEIGGIHRFAYDGSGRLTAVTDPVRAVDQITYNGRQRRWRNPIGALTTFEYDLEGRLVRETDPLGCVWGTVWDRDNRSVTTTDPLGRSIQTKRDRHGLPLELRLPDGRAWTRERSPDGRRVEISYPSGRRETWETTDDGRTTAWTQPGFVRQSWLRDAAGQVVAHVSPEGRTAAYRYDIYGNSVHQRNTDGSELHASVSPFGIPTAVTDAAGRVTAIESDLYGRLRELVGPGNHPWKWSRDLAGRVVSVTAPDQRSWRWRYDAAGRTVEETDPAGYIIRTRYDAAGRPMSRTDGAGRTTAYGWNLRDEQTSIRFPDGTTENYRWDAGGNLISRTDGRGVSTFWSYDTAGRLVAIRHSDTTPTATLLYDHDDRLIRLQDGTGTTSWTWGPTGDWIRRESAAGIVERHFDRDGRILQTIIQSPGMATRALEWIRDPSGNCVRVRLPDRTLIDYTTGLNGQVIERRHGDGSRVVWRINPETGWIDGMDAYRREGTLRERLTTVRDSLGRQVTQFSTRASTRSWEFDASGRLSKEMREGPWGRTTIHQWDGSGARRGRSVDGVVETWTGDAEGRPVATGPMRLTWDRAGNLSRIHNTQTGSASSLRWDAQSRLVSWDGPESGLIRRDGFGGILSITSGSDGTSSYLDDEIDGFRWQVIGDRMWISGPEGPLARIEPSGIGEWESTILVPDFSGHVRWDGDRLVEWDAFGNPLSGDQTVGWGLGWGYHPIGDLGLLFAGQRLMSPELGAFISRDPILASDTWYGYADGDPVNAADPSGLETLVFIPGTLIPTRGGGRTPGRLVLLDDDGKVIRHWPASTGGHRAPGTSVPPGMPTRLPEGKYRVNNPRRRDKAGMVRDSVGFSFDLLPNFPTRRTLLRIHPDGGPPGTQGCIGVIGDRHGLEDFYQRIRAIVRSEPLSLEVR